MSVVGDHPLPPNGGRRRSTGSWPFALPAVTVVALCYLLPLAINAALAFSSWSGFHSRLDFVGWKNLRTLYEQNEILTQIRLTIVYALTASLTSNMISLPLALAVERRSLINTLFRSVFFIPVLLSPLAAGYVWAGILDIEGPLNGAIRIIDADFSKAWLGDPDIAIYLVGFVDGWKWCGFFTLVYLAALSTVPTELKEAARVDGARASQVFRHVKVPFLGPAFTYNITVTLIGALSAFDIVVAMTGGGPGNSTRVLNVLTSDQFGAGYFSLASATSLVVSVLVVVSAFPLVSWLRRREIDA